MRRYILDAWAILAYLQKEEPAASKVKDILQKSLEGEVEVYMTLINIVEVLYILGRARGESKMIKVFAHPYKSS